MHSHKIKINLDTSLELLRKKNKVYINNILFVGANDVSSQHMLISDLFLKEIDYNTVDGKISVQDKQDLLQMYDKIFADLKAAYRAVSELPLRE